MRPGDGEPVLLNMTWLPTQMPYRRGGLQNNRSNRYLPLSARGRVDIVAPRSVVAPRSANELADELEIGRSSGSQGTQGSALRSTVHRARLGIRHPCVGVRHPCVGARHPCVGTAGVPAGARALWKLPGPAVLYEMAAELRRNSGF